MTDEALVDQELVARFLREARAAARLRGEHVARVTDVGTLESGAPYQVIEYLEGSDLFGVLSTRGPLPIAVAAQYVMQACEAVDEAHRAGIVHRDLKPSNLFLTKRPNGTPCIKVLDFGISKAERVSLAAPDRHTTGSRGLFGSPSYMAPEQMRSPRQVDGRADIWALGATLYELLSGRLPFAGETLMEIALQVAQSKPTPLRELRPEVPPALEHVVLTCLEKDPDRRFASANKLAAALAPFAGSLRPPRPRMDSDMDPISRSSRAPATGGGASVWRTAFGIALLGAIAAVAAFFLRPASGPSRAPESLAVHSASSERTAASPTSPGPSPDPQIPTLSINDLPLAADPALGPQAATGIQPATGAQPVILTAVGRVTVPQVPTAPPGSAQPAATGPISSAEPAGAGPAAPAAPVAAASVAPGCDPPFAIDDAGHLHFKPECLYETRH
jgi:serine/threonine-protein kinase